MITPHRKNEVVTLTITDISKEGEGIGKADGFTLFVRDAMPGDTIEAGITKLKKTYGYARLLRVISPSPDRVEPLCSASGPCGGCRLQNMSHDAQLRLKEKSVRDALDRIGCLTGTPLQPIVSKEPHTRWRNKAVIPVGYDKSGRLQAGFYAGHSHRIVPCEDCLISPEEYGLIVRSVLCWMKEEGIAAYDEATGNGLVRHIFLRKSREEGTIQLCLIVNGKSVPSVGSLRKRIEALREKGAHVSGAAFSANTRRTNVIFGTPVRTLWGNPVITDELHATVGKKTFAAHYRIAPASFFQVNPWVAEEICADVLRLADLHGTETVCELYCGIGTLSMFLAQHAGRLVGVEIVPEAVENARENARINGLSNTRFYEGKAEEIMPALYREQGVSADLVVVDPPRKGCDAMLLETIISMNPAKVIYVSCDPATLARDLRILAEAGWEPTYVRPYDQFVFSTHVEVVSLLVKRFYI